MTTDIDCFLITCVGNAQYSVQTAPDGGERLTPVSAPVQCIRAIPVQRGCDHKRRIRTVGSDKHLPNIRPHKEVDLSPASPPIGRSIEVAATASCIHSTSPGSIHRNGVHRHAR